jgi:hypothetical protein
VSDPPSDPPLRIRGRAVNGPELRRFRQFAGQTQAELAAVITRSSHATQFAINLHQDKISDLESSKRCDRSFVDVVTNYVLAECKRRDWPLIDIRDPEPAELLDDPNADFKGEPAQYFDFYAQLKRGIKNIDDIARECRRSVSSIEAAFRRLERAGTVITSVTRIHAKVAQGIVIRGRGFGPRPEFIAMEGGVDTLAGSFRPSISISNQGKGRHQWVAGRASAINTCYIGLRLRGWSNTEINIAGFTGPLGIRSGRYRIAVGDKLCVVVYGPLNQCGAAAVGGSPHQLQKKYVAKFDTTVVAS